MKSYLPLVRRRRPLVWKFLVFLILSSGSCFAQNLIVNGNAEQAPAGVPNGYLLLAIPGWSTSGKSTLGRYGSDTSFPGAGSPGAPDRGSYFFTGGQDSALSSINQVVDVSALAERISSNGYGFTLSGYFGGWQDQNDAAVLNAIFCDSNLATISQVSIGGVSASDRANATKLLSRTLTGNVPPGTRKIRFLLVQTRAVGRYNDGYADSLSFVLNPKPVPAIPRVALTRIGGEMELGWPSEAIAQYQIQVSDDLAGWINLGTPVRGNNSWMTRRDLMTGHQNRFYRMIVTNAP